MTRARTVGRGGWRIRLWPGVLAAGVAACSAQTPPEATTPDPADTAGESPPQAPTEPVSTAPPATTVPAPQPPPPVTASPSPTPPPSNAPTPEPPPATPASGDAQPASLTVTMLSRGKGVPEPARAAYRDIRAALEAQRTTYAITDLRTQRIGLEGEARLCIEFRSQRDADAALAELRKRVSGIDLLQVAEASCPSHKESKP